MDKSLYVAMTGAAQIMRAQAENNHNLANVSTLGFKSELGAFQSVAVQGAGFATRVNAVASGLGWDFSHGEQMTTGRDLDFAIQGDGWIAVQGPDGKEAYTRSGAMQVDVNGVLTTDNGRPVLGDGGPLTLPPHASVTIGADGTLSVIPLGQAPNTVAAADRIKLVNPPLEQLEKGVDGLMHLKGGGTAPADASVHLVSGVVESSNVNPSTALVRMIELSRQFEMQVRGIQAAERNAASSTKILQAT